MDIACTIAVSRFTDVACALSSIAKGMQFVTFTFCKIYFKGKTECVFKSKYKSSDHAKTLQKRARKKRKGIEDKREKGGGTSVRAVGGGLTVI